MRKKTARKYGAGSPPDAKAVLIGIMMIVQMVVCGLIITGSMRKSSRHGYLPRLQQAGLI